MIGYVVFPESRRAHEVRQEGGLHGVVERLSFRQPLNRHEMLLR